VACAQVKVDAKASASPAASLWVDFINGLLESLPGDVP
jgi:hypothetical protein